LDQPTVNRFGNSRAASLEPWIRLSQVQDRNTVRLFAWRLRLSFWTV